MGNWIKKINPTQLFIVQAIMDVPVQTQFPSAEKKSHTLTGMLDLASTQIISTFVIIHYLFILA